MIENNIIVFIKKMIKGVKLWYNEFHNYSLLNS